MNAPISWIRRLSRIGTWLSTLLFGVCVGRDSLGNKYYKARYVKAGRRERRWVWYKGEAEASMIPPEWHIWLHHMAAEPLSGSNGFPKPWMKPHEPNLTGTVAAWFPSGYTLSGGRRPRATGDYQAWKPNE